MAVTPVNSTLTVTTAGTRVQATTDTTINPTTIYFEALSSNAGYIYVGVSSVSSTQYITRLGAGEGVSFTAESAGSSAIGKSGVSYQLSSFYVDSSSSGDKVQMTYAVGG